MTLFVRDVIRHGKGKLSRIICLVGGEAVLFDLNASKTAISVVSYDGLLSGLKNGKVTLVTNHNLDAAPFSRESSAEKAAAQKRFAIVVGLMEQGTKLFDRVQRGRLVAQAARNAQICSRTVHGSLHRYWKFGMTLDALRPRFRDCGVRGNLRVIRIASLGRPGPHPGLPAPLIADEILTQFKRGTDRYYRDNRKNSLAEAYRLILKDLSTRCVYDETKGVPVTFVSSEGPLPTLRQYRYWYARQNRARTDAEARMTEAKFQMKHRPKLSWAAQDNDNAGGRYIIDSTPLDLNLVSRLDPSVFLSTPTLYIVIDEFTGFIVGFWLSLEDASWTAASMALRNAVEDKVAFCASYGIDISVEDWPASNYIASRLMFDKGEAKGEFASNFGLKSRLTIENTGSYRGDLKGICEQRFNLVNVALRGRLPGYRVKGSGKRGERDPRLDAVLDLEDAIRIIIHTVRYLNWSEIPTFRRSRAMLEDAVAPIPGEMWNWALKTGRTGLVRCSQEEIQVALLPSGEATVTSSGIEFKKLRYTCARAEQEGWFTCVSGPARLRKKTISFHPWLVDIVYVHGKEPGGYDVAVLTPHSQRYKGLSFDELEKLHAADRQRARARQQDQTLNFAEFSNAVGHEVSAAQKRRRSKLRRADLNGAREARASEREFDRNSLRRDLSEETLRGLVEAEAPPTVDQSRHASPSFPDDLGD